MVRSRLCFKLSYFPCFYSLFFVYLCIYDVLPSKFAELIKRVRPLALRQLIVPKEMSENIFGQIADKTRYVRIFVRILSEIFENMSEIKSAEIKLSEIVLSEIFCN